MSTGETSANKMTTTSSSIVSIPNCSVQESTITTTSTSFVFSQSSSLPPFNSNSLETFSSLTDNKDLFNFKSPLLNPTIGDRLDTAHVQKIIADRERLPLTRIRFAEKDKLDLKNWNKWNRLMMSELRAFKLTALIEREFDVTAQMSHGFRELDEVVKDQLYFNVCDEFQKQIENEPTAKQMYSVLRDHATGSGINRSVMLTMKLKSVLNKSSTTLTEYVADMQAIIREFASVFPTIPDEYWLGVAIGHIPSKFNYVRSNLSMRKDLTLQMVFSILLQEVQYIGQQQEEKRLLTNAGLKVDFDKKKKQTQNNSPAQQQPAANRPKCTYCNKEGHTKDKCFKLRRDKRKETGTVAGANTSNQPASSTTMNSQSPLGITLAHLKIKNMCIATMSHRVTEPIQCSPMDESTPLSADHTLIADQLPLNDEPAIGNYSESVNGGSNSFLPIWNANDSLLKSDSLPKGYYSTFINHILVSSISDKQISASKWYADSGAGKHMANNRVSCVSFSHIEQLIAQTANGNRLDTPGIGEYVCKAINGLVKFREVVYSPDLEASFVSIGCLDRLGFTSLFSQGRCLIFDQEGELVITGELTQDNLYELHLEPTEKVKIFNLLVRPPDESDPVYMHQLLGHVNFGDLERMSERLDLVEFDAKGLKCEECLLAKAPRLPFRSKNVKEATEKLELIHSDLSGIIRISNQNRYNYYATFTDDSCRYTVTYLLHSKSQALDAFRQYREYVELHVGSKTGAKIRNLRTDGGTEYMNKEFIAEIERMGIKKHTTCPYSPQQNAVSERINRTLGDMVRVLLLSAKLPVSLWPYAILHATYLKNRLPHSSINHQIPYELFFEKPVVYKGEHRWGERVIFVGHHSTSKFDINNNYGNYVGRPAGTKGYYVYVPSTGKVIVSHDVYFLNKMNTDPDPSESELSELFDHELVPSDCPEQPDLRYPIITSDDDPAFDASTLTAEPPSSECPTPIQFAIQKRFRAASE